MQSLQDRLQLFILVKKSGFNQEEGLKMVTYLHIMIFLTQNVLNGSRCLKIMVIGY